MIDNISNRLPLSKHHQGFCLSRSKFNKAFHPFFTENLVKQGKVKFKPSLMFVSRALTDWHYRLDQQVQLKTYSQNLVPGNPFRCSTPLAGSWSYLKMLEKAINAFYGVKKGFMRLSPKACTIKLFTIVIYTLVLSLPATIPQSNVCEAGFVPTLTVYSCKLG